MKLVTFKSNNGPRLGVLVNSDTSILDVQAAQIRAAGKPHPVLASMQALIEADKPGLEIIESLVDSHDSGDQVPCVEDVLLPPLIPVQMRDCLGFFQHIKNSMERHQAAQGLSDTVAKGGLIELFWKRPFWYKCNRMATVGTGTVVHWPAYSKLMDYEMEMGAIIWRRGVNIRKEDAGQHIFGYTIFNDFSARDAQADEMRTLGPAKSKDFDGANVLGPCIVTADEFDFNAAKMISKVNGEIQNEGMASSINYTFADMIAFINQSETIYPGEMIGSGTVGGGCGLEVGRLLQSGDVVELEITGIGKIRNQVIAE